MSPQRIQLRRTKGWRKPPGSVVVSRPSKWGNPFRIYHGHTLIGPPWSTARATWGHLPAHACVNAYVTSSAGQTAADAVAAFASLLQVRLRDEPDQLAAWLAPLRGRDLACWCPLTDAEGNRVLCHADVLLEIANGGAA